MTNCRNGINSDGTSEGSGSFYDGILNAWTNLKEADLDGVKRFAAFALQRYGSAVIASYMPASRSIGINFAPSRKKGRQKSLFTLRLDKTMMTLSIFVYDGDERQRKVPYAGIAALLDEEKLWADSDRYLADNVIPEAPAQEEEPITEEESGDDGQNDGEKTMFGVSAGDFSPDELLWQSLEKDDVTGIREALSMGADADDEKDNEPPLTFAAAKNFIRSAKALLDADADTECENAEGTPLMIAAGQGSTGMVTTLLAGGADVNNFQSVGGGPLAAAAKEGRMEVCKLLLDAGADINGRYIDGDDAWANGDTALTAAVKAWMTAREKRSGDGAALSAFEDLVLFLLEKGADINEPGDEDYTAIASAASCGDAEIVAWLLNRGADPDIETGYGETAFDLAKDNVEVLKILESGKTEITENAASAPPPPAMQETPAEEEKQFQTEKAKACLGEALNCMQKGDTVLFGDYHGAIEWLILDRKPDRMLLLSKHALDYKPYDKYYEDTTWEKCKLRQWLNGEFLSGAFSAEEQKCIILADVQAHNNPKYKTRPGKSTNDKVFLLSCKEAWEYLPEYPERVCSPTPYAKAQGLRTNDDGYCVWWLRSPGNDSDKAASADIDGSLNLKGLVVSCYYAVRPVLWINLES